MNKTVTILGSGGWGTAVATVLATNGFQVKLWSFEQDVADDIKKFRMNNRYLPGIELHPNIIPVVSIHEALTDVDVIFEATPVPFLRSVLELAAPYVVTQHRWVVLSKGIERGTNFFPSQIIENVLGYSPCIAAMSGPNFAQELAQQQYTATIVACKDDRFCKELVSLLANNYLKPFLSRDPIGAQVGGALKNVGAILLGILRGAGYQENTSTFLLTRFLTEMIALAEYYGGDASTIYGLSGLGDLILSSSDEKGRNFRIGKMIGAGGLLHEINEVMPVLPEGVNTTQSLYQIIEKSGLNAPLCVGTYHMLFEGTSIRSFIGDIMQAPVQYEHK